MYIKKTYYTGQIIEVEKIYTLRYKGRHSVRGPRVGKTSEAAAKVNARNAVKKLRRLINANFDQNATHSVLTYRECDRTTDAEKAKEDLAKFWRELRKECRKAGTELKYIAVAERGKRKRSIHFHCIIDCGLPLGTVQKCWPHGALHSTPLYGGEYGQLAAYLVKETAATFNDPENAVFKKRWNCSKNLVQPVPVVEIVKADSWREQPVAPKGFYVIPDSVYSGVSEISGWPFQYYSCKALAETAAKGGRKDKTKNHDKRAAKRKSLLC